jgi:hypothetical protein
VESLVRARTQAYSRMQTWRKRGGHKSAAAGVCRCSDQTPNSDNFALFATQPPSLSGVLSSATIAAQASPVYPSSPAFTTSYSRSGSVLDSLTARQRARHPSPIHWHRGSRESASAGTSLDCSDAPCSEIFFRNAFTTRRGPGARKIALELRTGATSLETRWSLPWALTNHSLRSHWYSIDARVHCCLSGKSLSQSRQSSDRCGPHP